VVSKIRRSVLIAPVLVALLLLHSSESGAQNKPLRVVADERGMLIGTAVSMGTLKNDSVYRDTLKREFNVIVAENAFKWEAVHPSQTGFNFNDTDALVDFASSNKMQMRGHTLVWHKQLPAWLRTGTFTRDEMIAILKEHIFTLVGRYKGKIKDWDVVNEAIDDDTGEVRKDTIWYKQIGPDYIKLAFEFAHTADPAARLYYNDYSAEELNKKSDGVYALVRDLKRQGAPINGVGWQMHQVNGFRINEKHYANAKRLADLGLEISMTELDVRMKLPPSAEDLQTQAQAYDDSIGFCLKTPNCKAVVLWGFTDAHSWIPGWYRGFGDALIYDKTYQTKPSYTAVNHALQQNIESIPRITGVSKKGNKLFVTGERFSAGAELFINGEKQSMVSSDSKKTQTTLLAGKSGDKVKTGDLIKVRNNAGLLSNIFICP